MNSVSLAQSSWPDVIAVCASLAFLLCVTCIVETGRLPWDRNDE